MGRKVKKIDLTELEHSELTKGYKSSNSAAYSRRCHMVLLKSQGKTSEEIAEIVNTTIQPVNRWCNRYLNLGVLGLENKPGQGRKPILNKKDDKEKVKAIVKKERQQLKQVKDDLENKLGKEFSLSTLKRFLKNLTADGNELD